MYDLLKKTCLLHLCMSVCKTVVSVCLYFAVVISAVIKRLQFFISSWLRRSRFLANTVAILKRVNTGQA